MKFKNVLDKVFFKGVNTSMNESLKNKGYKTLITLHENNSFGHLTEKINESYSKVKAKLGEDSFEEAFEDISENYAKEPTFELADNYIKLLSKFGWDDVAKMEQSQMENIVKRFKSHFMVASTVEELAEENFDLYSQDIEKLTSAMRLPSNMIFNFLAAFYNRQKNVPEKVRNLIHSLSRINPLSQNKIDYYTSPDGRFTVTIGQVPTLKTKDKKFYLVDNTLFRVESKGVINESLSVKDFQQEGEFTAEEMQQIQDFTNFFQGVVNYGIEAFLPGKDVTIDLTIKGAESDEIMSKMGENPVVMVIDGDTGESFLINCCDKSGQIVIPGMDQILELNSENISSLSETIHVSLLPALKKIYEDGGMDAPLDLSLDMGLDIGAGADDAEGGEGADAKGSEEQVKKLEDRLTEIEGHLTQIDELEDSYKEDKDIQELFLKLTGEKTIIEQELAEIQEKAAGTGTTDGTGENPILAEGDSSDIMGAIKGYCDKAVENFIKDVPTEQKDTDALVAKIDASDLENKENIKGWIKEFSENPKDEILYNKITGQMNEEENGQATTISTEDWSALVGVINANPDWNVKKTDDVISGTYKGEEKFKYTPSTGDFESSSSVKELMDIGTAQSGAVNESRNDLWKPLRDKVKKIFEEGGMADTEMADNVIVPESDEEVEKMSELLEAAGIEFGVYENSEVKVPYLLLESKKKSKSSKKIKIGEGTAKKFVDNKTYMLKENKHISGMLIPKGTLMTYNEELDLVYAENETPIDGIKVTDVEEYKPLDLDTLKEGCECSMDDVNGNLKYNGNYVDSNMEKVYSFTDSNNEEVKVLEESCKRFIKILK